MWTLLWACGTEVPPTAHDHADHHDHAPAKAGADAPAPSLHGSHSEHMKLMSATRDRLRKELGDAYDAPVPGLDTADAAKGAASYATHCAGCHGETGKGDGPSGKDLSPPAADFTDAFHARYYSDAGRVQIIRDGSPGTAMAGFEGTLAEDEILAIYRHVAGLRGAPGR